MTNQGRDFRSPPCEFCGGVHLGTQPGRCVYQCSNCGEDTRPRKPLAAGETWQHKCDTPRSQDEIEEKKFEQLIELPDDLHDAEGRPISLIEEMADESKLSAFVAETTKEFTSLRCCDCRCGHAPKDHIVTGETEFCRPCLIAAGHPYESRREL